jgi:hypothetical protein
MRGQRSIGERLAMGVIAGLVAFGLAYLARPRHATPPRARATNVLDGRTATFELRSGAAQITARARDGSVARDIDLLLVVDGAPHPFALARDDMRPTPHGLTAAIGVPVDDALVELTLELRADRSRDDLAIAVAAPAAFLQAGHTVALRAEIGSPGEVVFVPGVGQIADRATVTGSAVVVDSDPHPVAILSADGPVSVDAVPENTAMPIEPMRLSVTAPFARASEAPRTDLALVVGDSSMGIWRTLGALAGVATAPVRGRVTGTAERSVVFGRDAEGHPQVRARAGPGGRFALEAPPSVVQWYAAIDPGRASSVAPFVPGTPRDIELDVSPGGDLHVAIVDADTHAALTARLLVHGIEGTVDPSFGPDYRASGAGPVIDALRGEVTTPLPSGRYRVAATRGTEWSIDAKVIEIAPGRVTELELAPRHVVPTPGVVGCDLHVHARPSFDTPVTPEDRVISLAAAGVDFAVPTEHNLVGDYASALETLDLNHDLLSVPGVEVTTYGKGFGHFGVFPYPTTAPVPPYKHTSMAAIFRAVRAGDPNRFFQLNHPRLPKGIGYFNNIGFDPKGPRTHVHNRVDFDGIEVFNGYDNEFPERIEQVLRDYWALLDFGWREVATGSSDSHRIQFHWAGYPRTMVMVDPAAASSAESERVGAAELATLDPMTIVANIKKGHAVVTSGPMIELSLGAAHPGDELMTGEDPVHGHIRVRAAPWIDVTRVEVIVGEVGGSHRVAQTFGVPSRPTTLGPEPGTLAEAQERTVRLDLDLDVPVGPSNGWVQVVVRGDRRMDDVLPFMPVTPFGFTNPIYVVRNPVPPPPFPGVGSPAGLAPPPAR